MPDKSSAVAVQRAVKDMVNTLTSPFYETARLYAEALVQGRISATVSPSRAVRVMAEFHPELSLELVRPDRDGWKDGIGLVHALAHGHVLDELDENPGWEHPWTVNADYLAEAFGPTILDQLRSAFAGDVTAAASAIV